MITSFKLFESKNIQNLYHILDIEKLYYVLKNNEIKSYHFPFISTTRNKMMTYYAGCGPVAIFKLELDGPKLSDNYKMKSFQDSGWETGGEDGRKHFYHQEWEEQIQTDVIKNIRKYIVRIILLKNRIESLKDSAWFESHFYARGRKEKWRNFPEIIKDIMNKYNIELWVQDGSVIKKDDEYVDSILNYKVRNMYHGFALYWRGYVKHPKGGFREKSIPFNDGNADVDPLVVGRDYNNIWVKNKIENVDNLLKHRPEIFDNDCSLNVFDFEYTKQDIIKKEGDYILIRSGKLCDIDILQKYDYSLEKEIILKR